MKDSPKPPVELVGLVRVRSHCVFSWSRGEGTPERTAQLLPTHCAACIEELGKLGYGVDTSAIQEPPSD